MSQILNLVGVRPGHWPINQIRRISVPQPSYWVWFSEKTAPAINGHSHVPYVLKNQTQQEGLRFLCKELEFIADVLRTIHGHIITHKYFNSYLDVVIPAGRRIETK